MCSLKSNKETLVNASVFCYYAIGNDWGRSSFPHWGRSSTDIWGRG